MSDTPLWLPDLVLFEKYDGDWQKYLNALYEFFTNDFIHHKTTFRGVPLQLKRHPMKQGKEATFWHFIQAGDVEEERTPDIRRCERICWPRPVIEHAANPILKVWENKRKGERRICLWLEGFEYLVVLADRKNYLLPWTAYLVTKDHQKRKLEKEYQDFLKQTGTA